MKKVLFAGLLAIAGVSVSAQNLIKNEKFATEVKTKVTNANKATAGEWFIMNNEADGATPEPKRIFPGTRHSWDSVLPTVWKRVSMFSLSMQKLRKPALR